ncbi:MAG: hypothetical protein NTX19_09285 [Gemmatimonadetes bacterium]|nr:hypothetical protein [Gemmatimonadota bacterium]
MKRGRINAYLKFQLGDFLILRAGLPTLVAVMFGYMLWKQMSGSIDWTTPQGQGFALQVFQTIASVFITIGSFLGVARIVADDRSNGYFRFLFSKPVSIERFYAQQWLLYGIGFVAIAGLLGYWFQSATTQMPVTGLMVVMGLNWILIGGVGFLLSAAINADAAVLVFVYVLSTILHTLKDAPFSRMWPWLKQLTRVTLPVHKVDFIRNQLYAGNSMPWMHATHVIMYGMIAFVLGLVVLRRSSFAR